MIQSGLPLQQLCDAAIRAATAAGEFIQSVDRTKIDRQYKDAGSTAASQLVTDVDLASETIIRKCLDESCTALDIAFVGEESSQGSPEEVSERHTKSHFWCVDPLDGTLPFVAGNPGYAVSIALVRKTGEPLLGVVYDPSNKNLIHGIKGQGVYNKGVPFNTGSELSNKLMVFADASFQEQSNYDNVREVLNASAQRVGLKGVELIYGSGAVKNACQVLEYPAACYVKLPKSEPGGGSIWDFAATACIVREAGAWASDIHGQALNLNRSGSTFMNREGVLFASTEQIARLLIDELSL